MDNVELSEAPKIMLGKKQWPVPEMAARQLIHLVPAMMRASKIAFDDLSEEDMRLLYDVTYIALTRAHPNLTREEFENLPVTFDQLVVAIPIIAKQAGMQMEVGPQATAGEAQAAAPPTT